MPIYTFYQSSSIKLPTFRSSSSCFWKVFLSWFRLCGYHGYCWAYLSHLSILYQTQVQSYKNVFIALVLTGNSQRDGAALKYIIGSPVVVDAELIIFLFVWMVISSRRLTMPSIVNGGGGGRGLNPYLSVVGWINFWVVTRMDIALGGLKAYQRLIGILSVMTRIDISCNFTY